MSINTRATFDRSLDLRTKFLFLQTCASNLLLCILCVTY